jgi:signal transduction histidine kinase
MQMENGNPNQSTNQVLLQHISEAAVFTDPSFIITACNKAAIELFLYTQQELAGYNISKLALTTDTTNVDFTDGITTYTDRLGKKIPLTIARHTIAHAADNIGYLFIYKPVDADQEFPKTTAQLRELSDYLLNIRETERTNIAREIHDELGQQLTILKMDISWLHQKLQKYDDAALIQRSGETLKMLNETIKTVRRIATELRPSMLDDLGLIEALEWQSKEFEKRSGIMIDFESGIPHLPVSDAIATSLFRIYQEALTNIARHANAKNVFSKLQLNNDQVILSITDDGSGFDMKTLGVKKTLGLLGMKERTFMMGGRFEINSKRGEGTSIAVTIALQPDDLAKLQTDQ